MIELAAALQAESAAVRWQAIEKLNQSSRLRPASETTLSILVTALADEHPFVRWQAGLALARHNAGWQKLMAVLKGEPSASDEASSEAESSPQAEASSPQPKGNDVAQSAAIDALAAVRSPEINALLIETLQTGSARLRQSAAEALAYRGNSEAVSPLLAALDDPDPWVRRAAAYALGHIGEQSAAGVLLGRLSDQAVIVRRSAAYALGALRAPVAAPRLKIALTDPDPPVRRNAAWALGRIGQADLAPHLEPLLGDPALDGTIAATARQAITTLTKPRWLQALLGLRQRFQ